MCMKAMKYGKKTWSNDNDKADVEISTTSTSPLLSLLLVVLLNEKWIPEVYHDYFLWFDVY